MIDDVFVTCIVRRPAYENALGLSPSTLPALVKKMSIDQSLLPTTLENTAVEVNMRRQVTS
jgi:hypothetical protein